VDVEGVALLQGRVLADGHVPQVEDLLVVGLVEDRQVVVQEGADQLEDGTGGLVARDHAEEGAEHLAQRLDQQRRVIEHQLRQFVALESLDYDFGLQLCLGDHSRDESDNGPEHIGTFDFCEGVEEDGYGPVDYVFEVDCVDPSVDEFVDALAAADQHLPFLLAALLLHEAQQHVRQGGYLLVVKPIHPACHNGREPQLDAWRLVDELQNLQHGEILERQCRVLLAAVGENGHHTQQVVEGVFVDVVPAGCVTHNLHCMHESTSDLMSSWVSLGNLSSRVSTSITTHPSALASFSWPL